MTTNRELLSIFTDCWINQYYLIIVMSLDPKPQVPLRNKCCCYLLLALVQSPLALVRNRTGLPTREYQLWKVNNLGHHCLDYVQPTPSISSSEMTACALSLIVVLHYISRSQKVGELPNRPDPVPDHICCCFFCPIFFHEKTRYTACLAFGTVQ